MPRKKVVFSSDVKSEKAQKKKKKKKGKLKLGETKLFAK